MWIADNILGWRDFKVVDAVKYLGFFLGQAASAHIWTAPIAKWTAVAGHIASSAASPAIAAVSYNRRAVTTMSYVAQLTACPHGIAAKDANIARSIVGLVPQSLPRNAYFQFPDIGGPALRRVETLINATRIRAAAKTLSTWRDMRWYIIN